MVKKASLLLLCILMACSGGRKRLKAYYTRTSYHDSHSGKWADVIVEIEDTGKLIFGRATDFMPVWKTDSGEWRMEAFFNRQPDPYQYYSYIRVLKNTPEEIVIHLRYMPDLGQVDFRGVVHELFTITPDGKVVREGKKATERIDEWNEPHFAAVEKSVLSVDGVRRISFNKGRTHPMRRTLIRGAMSIKPSNEPALWFTFDEGMKSTGNTATERICNREFEVEGHKTRWKQGISGTALAFDGYYSAIRVPPAEVPAIEKGFSVEGSIALGAYPFDRAPIVQQSEWGIKGFYLGIDRDGYPGFHMREGEAWISVVDSIRLPTFEWHHVAAVYDRTACEVTLFVDGTEKDRRRVSGSGLLISDSELMIGMNGQKMPPLKGRIRIGKYPSLYGLDGLIDEVRLYDQPLAPGDIETLCRREPRDKPDLEIRRFPRPPIREVFGAEYTRLEYYETWDNMWRETAYPDVVVNFDKYPVQVISWRGLSYGPALVSENRKWIGDQSSENYRELDDPSPAEGCCEHMSDKQCRHAHIRIIESTDARVVLHYRYGLVDSRYTFVYSGHDSLDWADEYWTIYPDGVMVRDLDRGPIWGDSWVETMFFSQPGTRPEDNADLNAYTLVNGKAEKETYSWKDGSPDCGLEGPVIALVNTKSEYKMFNIYPAGSEVETFGGRSSRSAFHWWNHWPAAQLTSDGRGARAADRAAHSSLVWGIPSETCLMYGFTNGDPLALLPLAGSWNHPPVLTGAEGCRILEYRREERAYHLIRTGETIAFNVNGSGGSPLVNPCFVIRNWGGEDCAVIMADGITVEPDCVRQGLNWDSNGTRTLVVWIEMESVEPVKIEIKHGIEHGLNGFNRCQRIKK